MGGESLAGENFPSQNGLNRTRKKKCEKFISKSLIYSVVTFDLLYEGIPLLLGPWVSFKFRHACIFILSSLCGETVGLTSYIKRKIEEKGFFFLYI